MRKIKFRFWYKGTFQNQNLNAPKMVYWPGDDINLPVYLSQGIVMQFTSLTDRNGKEIYEGDVLQQTLLLDRMPTGVVEFDPDLTQFAVRYKRTDSSGLGEGLCNLVGFGGKDIEVIGNIYENPGLVMR